MVMIGADVDELRLSGKVLEQSASDIVDHIAPALDKALTRTAWSGPDANSFKSLWFSSLSPSLKTVAGELDKAAKTLRNNADAQENTSAQGGGFATSGGGTSGISLNPSGDVPNIQRMPRQGEHGFRRDLMDLAAAAYDHTTGDSHERLIPDGWEEVSREELAKLGIDRDLLGVYGSEFSATVFRRADGTYVIAFEGTNPSDLRDWGSNGLGGLFKGVSAHDVFAAKVARHVYGKLKENGVPDDKIVWTGHSLGGRQATVASIATGTKAITFNSAGTSDMAVDLVAGVRERFDGHRPSREEIASNVHNVVHRDDILRWLRKEDAKSLFLGIDAPLVGSIEEVGIERHEWFMDGWAKEHTQRRIDHHSMDEMRKSYDYNVWREEKEYRPGEEVL